MTTIRDISLTLNDGSTTTLNELAPDKLVLLVNTASECGLAPQFEGLQNLQDTYGERGFTVVSAPSNQFMGQEPRSDVEIADFCSNNYNVDFPLLSKLEVNGEGAHPLYQDLTTFTDDDGEAGDVSWNFEKFLISPDGEVVGRIRPQVRPEDEKVTSLIQEHLPA